MVALVVLSAFLTLAWLTTAYVLCQMMADEREGWQDEMQKLQERNASLWLEARALKARLYNSNSRRLTDV